MCIEVIKTISSPFIFFLMKRFRAHKNTSHLKVYERVKNCCLCSLVSIYFCFVNWFLLVTCFLRAKSLPQIKINRLKFALITSIYNTTSVYPYQPTYWEFVCTDLFLFVIICENLFFLWESFWISSYLWSSVRIYFFKPLWG